MFALQLTFFYKKLYMKEEIFFISLLVTKVLLFLGSCRRASNRKRTCLTVLHKKQTVYLFFIAPQKHSDLMARLQVTKPEVGLTLRI